MITYLDYFRCGFSDIRVKGKQCSEYVIYVCWRKFYFLVALTSEIYSIHEGWFIIFIYLFIYTYIHTYFLGGEENITFCGLLSCYSYFFPHSSYASREKAAVILVVWTPPTVWWLYTMEQISGVVSSIIFSWASELIQVSNFLLLHFFCFSEKAVSLLVTKTNVSTFVLDPPLELCSFNYSFS